MTALARMTRKTVRRGRNGPVRLMAWFVVLLEVYLTESAPEIPPRCPR